MGTRLFAFAVVMVSVGEARVRADTKRDDEVTKQKETADANLKAAGIGTTTFAETADLLVYATSAEAKTKALATTLQKTYTTAAKALQIGNESPWAGKLTVVVLADRKKFGEFVRDAERRRLESGDAASIQIRGPTPSVVQGFALGEKPTEAQIIADACASVAFALLQSRAGLATGTAEFRLPNWVQTGFGRAAANRAEGPAKATAQRTKARGLLTRGKAGPFKVAELWGESPPKDADTLAASIVDYMAFGPDAAKFPTFVQGFRPTDENANPTAETALTAAGWKADALDANWKKWLVTGK